METDKKVNQTYGLNGTGKSTLSNFLHKQSEGKFKDCSIEGLDDGDEILAYNQTFIQESFFESEHSKGIFTLSKENKEAETKISAAQKEIVKLEGEKGAKTKELETERSSINQKLDNSKSTF